MTINNNLEDEVKEGFMGKIGRKAGKITGFLGLLTALSPLGLKAYSINGNVKDIHEHKNMADREVVIKDVNDPSRIKTAYTDANGDFSVDWSFNQAPVVYNISPENGATGVSTSPELKVVGTDGDDDPLSIEFYKASNDSLIGSDNIQSGDTASIVWNNLDESTLYEWYVKAADGEDTTTSNKCNFTTESSGGITEEEKNKIDIFGEDNILKVIGDYDDKFEGDILDANGRKVGELEEIMGSEYGFSVSKVPQGVYFMILKRNGENIAQVKFLDVENKVFGVSPKWNIEEDNVSSSDSYKKETNSSNERTESLKLRSTKLDSLEFLIKGDSGTWERVTYRTANPDETNNYDFSVIDKTIFDSTMMDFYNEITGRGTEFGTARWVLDTIQYMVDTTDMSQAMINTIVSIINDEVIYMTNNQITPVINFTNTHPEHYYGADTINIYVDNDIPGMGEHSEESIEGYDNNDYTLETAYVKLVCGDYLYRGVILQEILQTLGWVCDSDLENSVFNGSSASHYLTEADSLSRILYLRNPKNIYPDEDSKPEGW
ncbi:hypothetical protein JW949_04280 [Candidatus Woesearchaeota archaeon]|nr:hypothetical protein [Candidatus Woesearchaeota archaeon]